LMNNHAVSVDWSWWWGPSSPPVIMTITLTWRASCRCFNPTSLPRSTRGRWLRWGSSDLELEGMRKTRDTRFIQVQAAKVANPTSCLGDQVWHPVLGVGLRYPVRYPTFLYIVQGAGS
jgi:hypothetical protein